MSLKKELAETNAPNGSLNKLSFEFITHRFSARAKSNILKVFPETKLPMDESERKFKFGQFGYGKYLYQPEEIQELKTFFYELTEKFFPGASIEYFV